MLCMFALIPFSENTLAGTNHKQSPFPCCFIRWWVQVQYYQRFQQAAVMAAIMEATVMSYHNRLVHLHATICGSLWKLDSGLDWTEASCIQMTNVTEATMACLCLCPKFLPSVLRSEVSFLNFWEISHAYRTSTKVTIAESFWLQKQGLSIHLIETMHVCA